MTARYISVVVVVSVALSSMSCATSKTVERRQIPASDLLDEQIPLSRRMAERNRLQTESEYLKVHMLSGDVYVLERRYASTDSLRRYSPQIKLEDQVIFGFGNEFDGFRNVRQTGWFEILLDSVAIMETNTTGASGSVGALTIVTGLSAALTVFCLTNTKACFGSCPTFYVSDGDSLRLTAEGFSSSIAPSLEARDIDALSNPDQTDSVIDVQMRNEALETHVVRYVNLLALPKSEGEHVFKEASDVFWTVSEEYPVISCDASEGTCLDLVQSTDGRERLSEADSVDLGAKETILLTFDDVQAERLGLVIRARQSLLSTYLLYQTFAYMGRDVGKWIATLERNRGKLYESGVGKALGGIEVQIANADGEWETVDEVGEHGPLASDAFIVPLPEGSDASRIRLRLTKGNWRIDFAELAEIGSQVAPIRLSPFEVLRDEDQDPDAFALLRSETEALTTLPGDRYVLRYRVPERAGQAEFFIESKGYYLEWIRDEWVREENPQLLMQMLLTPTAALRTHARQFKEVEPLMEDAFWRSRYAGYQE